MRARQIGFQAQHFTGRQAGRVERAHECFLEQGFTAQLLGQLREHAQRQIDLAILHASDHS
ncbi:hypothetical protein D3C72_1113220 [compost metagenome]